MSTTTLGATKSASTVCDARGILHGAQRSVVGADGGDGRVDDVDAA
jgi:hypothetical protein